MLTRSSTSFGSAGRSRSSTRASGRSRARVADRQDVAFADRAPLEAADHAERVGRAAAEHDRHVDAAGDRDVRAGAGAQEVEREHLPRLDGERGPAGLLLAVELERQVGAGDGDHGVLLELERRPAERRLEHGRALVVADEQVGGAEGVVVERARGRHAEVVEPEAPRVLDGRAHAAVVDADHAYNLRTSSAL